jgi:adenylate kinase family enzyme
LPVTRWKAILLLGPTGSGKTPLGDHLEQHGLWGRTCVHVDFGRELRRAAAGDGSVLGADQVEYVRWLLQTGELLDDEHFCVGECILQEAVRSRNGRPDDYVVLNGLPRRVGQAEDLEPIVDVGAVVRLCCPAEIAIARIRTNAGGDRSQRPDDGLAAVRRRLARFDRLTTPLVDWYRQRGATICEVDVDVATTPAEIAAALESTPPDR